MKLYETVFIVRQDATPNQVELLAQDYTQIIRTSGGEVAKTEFCGLRSLAYPIKKNTKGHYVLMNIKATADVVKEVERQMKLNENVLRYLTIKVEAHDPNPSPLMQQKNFNPDRNRGYDDDQDDLLPAATENA
ncbi:30S ribosomal protein S6 [Candidatus Odyssella thessalonicensis]|uniref:30S ribosomal protein S6 n=1 Tax=Candidatus Odyssella thessalonicensis TaxID=84647 RepID=UPI000225C073|nr:30S ribosomal protein S6 [Candidatus Odyssella thessalonicensis]